MRRLRYRWRKRNADRNIFRVDQHTFGHSSINSIRPFVRPFNVYIGKDNYRYVTEMDEHRIIRFTPDWQFAGWSGFAGRSSQNGNDWHMTAGPGIPTADIGGFDRPHALVQDNAGRFCVTELNNRRVQRFDGEMHTSEILVEDRQQDAFSLAGPVSTHFDSDGRFYIADFRGNSVLCFSSDGCFQQFIGNDPANGKVSGAPTDYCGDFLKPHAAVPTPGGFVIVVDTWNHRLVRFTNDGQFAGWLGAIEDGRPAKGWMMDGTQPRASSGPGGFNAPVHVAVGRTGTLYVAEYGNHRIQRFTGNGKFTGWIGKALNPSDHRSDTGPVWRETGTPTFGRAPGEFKNPYHLDVADNRLLVADTENGRVQEIVFANTSAL